MTDLLMVDSAYPLSLYPNVNVSVVLIYIGGDTPHVWTDAEIAAQKARYRLPTYVRSNPASANVTADAAAAVAWLKAHDVPVGTATVLDLETAVDVSYVNAYGALLHDAGYKVLPYGSESTLFQNPKLDGYFVAEPGAKTVDPRSVITQFDYAGPYDLSWVTPAVPLWDTQTVNPDPVDTGTRYDALVPGFNLAPAVPEVGVIGQLVNASGLARTRGVSGGKTVYAGEGSPTTWHAGFNAKTLPAGTALAVAFADLESVSTVKETIQL